MPEGTGDRGQGTGFLPGRARGSADGSRFKVQGSKLGGAAAAGCTQYSVLSTQYFRELVLISACLGFWAAQPARTTAQESSDVIFIKNLTALAAKCDELGLKEQAQITRGWPIERHPRRQYLFLPAASDSTAPKGSAPEAARQWHRRFMELRRERAAELFAAAKGASDG